MRTISIVFTNSCLSIELSEASMAIVHCENIIIIKISLQKPIKYYFRYITGYNGNYKAKKNLTRLFISQIIIYFLRFHDFTRFIK